VVDCTAVITHAPSGSVEGDVLPGPIIPDYGGANIRGIVPALLGPAPWATDLPRWMPSSVSGADAVALLILDGLGWDQLQERLDLAPTLASMQGSPIDSVAPTTTATALTSIATGLTPGEHGIIGYRMVLGGEVVNMLRWTVADQSVRRTHAPSDVQPFDAFLGRDVAVISPAELQTSAFSEAHLRGARPLGWRAASSIPVLARRELDAGARFVYCYYGGIDKVAHERGFGDFYDTELRYADWLVARMIEVLPPRTALLVTADHGQVEVGSRVIHPSPSVLAGVSLQSGEGRFRWLHTRPGAAASVLDAAREELGGVAWVVPVEQTFDERWFGASVPSPIRSRLGDVALVARDDVSFYEAADTGPFELVCRHGSLTSAEVRVPLLAAPPR
jgi:hypothetical protein